MKKGRERKLDEEKGRLKKELDGYWVVEGVRYEDS